MIFTGKKNISPALEEKGGKNRNHRFGFMLRERLAPQRTWALPKVGELRETTPGKGFFKISVVVLDRRHGRNTDTLRGGREVFCLFVGIFFSRLMIFKIFFFVAEEVTRQAAGVLNWG